MANILKPKRRTADGTAPTTGNLQDGEFAINTFARAIYQRVGSNVIMVANYFSGAWSDITGKPTTLAGYGITDAASSSHNHNTSYVLKSGDTMTWTLDVATNATSLRGLGGKDRWLLQAADPSGATVYGGVYIGNDGNTSFATVNGGWTELRLAGGTAYLNGHAIYHEGNFNPATKANLSGAEFTGPVRISHGVSGGVGGEFYITRPPAGTSLTGDVTVDVAGDAVRVFAPNSSALGYGGIQFQVGGANGIGTAWSTLNFNPATKLDMPSVDGAWLSLPTANTYNKVYTTGSGWTWTAPAEYTAIWSFAGQADGSTGLAISSSYGSANEFWLRGRYDNGGSEAWARWKPWARVWTSANFNPDTKASLGASVNFVDITATRGDNTGVVYIGNAYLYNTGSTWQLSNHTAMSVGGYQVWTANNFNPTAQPAQTIAGGPVLTHEDGRFRVEGTVRAYGRYEVLAANSSAWVPTPRTFVQSGDPGAQAAENDLWIW